MKLYGADQRLEGRLQELYRRHRELTAKIDWSYHAYLPWEKGRNFQTDPWEPGQGNLSAPTILAVETALLTEVNLPWFTSGLNDVFRGSLEVLHDFVHTWTAEEDQHSNLLETYLLLTRNGDPERLHKLHKGVVREGWAPEMDSAFQTMAYTSIQELATMVFYKNVARTADSEDPDLSRLLRRLAKDETLHYAFYRDAVKAHLELEPNYVYPLVEVVLGFQMPGAGMPDFKERMKLIAQHAGYGPAEYFRQVIEVLARDWDLKNLHPTYQPAMAALDRMNTHHERLARLALRAEKRGRSVIETPEGSALLRACMYGAEPPDELDAALVASSGKATTEIAEQVEEVDGA